jgi:hypothetical protein
MQMQEMHNNHRITGASKHFSQRRMVPTCIAVATINTPKPYVAGISLSRDDAQYE